MRLPSPARLLLAVAVCLAFALNPATAVVQVSGSTTVNPVVVEAAALLTDELGITIRVDTLCGSSGGIAALSDGRADVAMSSRPLRSSDQEEYPAVRFRPLPIGVDADQIRARRVTDALACLFVCDGAGELLESGPTDVVFRDSRCCRAIHELEKESHRVR